MLSMRFPSFAALVVLILLWLTYTSVETVSFRSRFTHKIFKENSKLEQDAPSGDLAQDISNVTAGFQEIFVINLLRRTDRKDVMTLAAAFSKLKLSWINGVSGKDVDDNTLPLMAGQPPPSEASKGSWRAHLNAIQTVVEQDMNTALIMEDDLDWDIRIKNQLSNFAMASRVLIQPQSLDQEQRPTKYVDPSYPHPEPDQDITTIRFHDRPDTIPPTTSPYGDDWDVLWLGHCGMATPQPWTDTHSRGRVVLTPDDTVPVRSKLDTGEEPATPINGYPNHTRLYHHVHMPVCSLAYAVSQRGARRILYELSVKNYTSEYDNMLREMCDGEEMRGTKLTCLTTQPALFTHWKPRGSRKKESDISSIEDEWRETGWSRNMRWSVRLNMEKLVRGDVNGWTDQWPD